MQPDQILVRFGELTTKGKNRKNFTSRLLRNLKNNLYQFPDLSYQMTYDHIYIKLNGEDPEAVSEALKKVFGIHSFSICYKMEADLELVKQAACQLIENHTETTFKIETRRNDKSFPMTSMEMNVAIAGYIFHHASRPLKVDVHHPDILIRVEYRKDCALVMDNIIKGAGGYPVGIGGRALLMLSGGIDSPVAGYLTMKRGIDLECIHYASPPYTNDLAKEKVLDLVNVLKDYTKGNIAVHIVPFTKLQLSVYENCDESYAMTVMRRMMYRIAEQVAQKRSIKAIVNGESIGQVASQTLDSMQVINSVITTPVIRPVACMDKLEIIDLANRIDTYEISIRPFEDCCTIFTPKNPATKPKAYRCEAFEAKWDYQKQIDECIAEMETIYIDRHYKNDEDIF
ncbi:MAG: tRNA uracil 4-sulfurtransferase ThiI [bacterium]